MPAPKPIIPKPEEIEKPKPVEPTPQPPVEV